MSAVVVVVALGLLSWLLRVVLIAVVPPERLPGRLVETLPLVAPAVIGSLVAVELTGLLREQPDTRVFTLLAAAGVAVLAWRTRSPSLVCGAGLLVVLALDLLLAAG